MMGLCNPFPKWYARDSEYYDPNPAEWMRLTRRSRARKLWGMRKELRSIRHLGPDLIRRYCDAMGAPKAEPKPTAEILYQRAWNNLRAAGWHNSRMGALDTEYYSACGHDDACGERAHACRVDSVAYITAARKLKWAKAWGFEQ